MEKRIGVRVKFTLAAILFALTSCFAKVQQSEITRELAKLCAMDIEDRDENGKQTGTSSLVMDSPITLAGVTIEFQKGRFVAYGSGDIRLNPDGSVTIGETSPSWRGSQLTLAEPAADGHIKLSRYCAFPYKPVSTRTPTP